MQKKVLLIILDGFGEGKVYPGNAIALAKTPTITELKKKYPWAILKASGRAVGIPDGTQGGSEVGHFTIGAGRVVLQPFDEINNAIEDGSFYTKPALVEACKKGKTLHLIGMISDQGVHSHIHHLFALLELAKQRGVKQVKIHAITDGRDVPEKSAEKFITQILEKIDELGMEKVARIATIVGRYHAMDRDENWERIKPAYDLFTLGKGRSEKDPLQAIQNAYERGVETDYYIDPIVLDPEGKIGDDDAVIFWNFRSDRAREITWCFTGEKNPKTGKQIAFTPEKIVRPYFVCLGPYSEVAPVVFHTPIVHNNLGQVISQAGLNQLRIGETQKYAHVTYFLNSQVETPLKNEDRLMIDSKKCHSYAEIPEMSAREITDALLKKLSARQSCSVVTLRRDAVPKRGRPKQIMRPKGATFSTYSFIALNFANCDLVGHSGDLKATIKAVEVVDECLGKIVPAAKAAGYTTIITGDHGNAEYKIYEDTGEDCPSHTTNPVPCIIVGNWVQGTGNSGEKGIRKKGELKDIAPTILAIIGIPQPKEMTGENLLL